MFWRNDDTGNILKPNTKKTAWGPLLEMLQCALTTAESENTDSQYLTWIFIPAVASKAVATLHLVN